MNLSELEEETSLPPSIQAVLDKISDQISSPEPDPDTLEQQ
jgi:hypothetical protein